MSKKKENKAFREGMKAGAKPFEAKFDKSRRDYIRTTEHLTEVQRNQYRQKRVVNKTLDAVKETRNDIKGIKERTNINEKNIKNQKKEIDKIKYLIPNINTTCHKCGKPIEQKQMVCVNCGSIVKTMPYNLSDFNIESECFEAVADISETIKNTKLNSSECIYEEFDEKFLKVKKIREIARKENKKKDSPDPIYGKIIKNANAFLRNCKNEKIEIVIVGTVKAGKSSLINAMIGDGYNIASVAATPETSVLVKYRTTKDQNYLKVKFYTEKQWSSLWNTVKDSTTFKNEYYETGAEGIKSEYLGRKEEEYIIDGKDELSQKIMEWTRSDSPKHFFVSELEVGYQNSLFPSDVFLVDTPGLDDPVKYRSNITRKYIKNADRILACVVAENVSQASELEFLTKVIQANSHDKEGVIVVATKKDMLKKSDWDSKRGLLIKQLGEIYENEEAAAQHLLSVSAALHTLFKKYILGVELVEEDMGDFKAMLNRVNPRIELSTIQEYSDEVKRYAGVDGLFDKIDKTIIQKRRQILKKKIEDSYLDCINVVNSYSNDYIEDKNELLDRLIFENADNAELIKQLEEADKEVSALEDLVKVLKQKLYKEINENNISLKEG